jgi:hypothetical protein
MLFARQAQNSDVARAREREHHRCRLANRTPYHGFAQERPLQTGPAVRFLDLRLIVSALAIAGAAATAGGCVEAVIDSDCVDTLEESYHFESPADPPLQFRIDRCRLDVDVCKELCDEAIARDGHASEQLSRCQVSFNGSKVSVEVSYEVFTSGDGCVVIDPPFPEPTFLAPISRPAPAPPASVLKDALLPTSSQARERSARSLDSLWNDGGRTCHA